MKAGAVLFDLDDTLYPEEQFVLGGYRTVAEVLRQEQGIEVYEELVALFREGRHQGAFEQLLRRHGRRVTEPILQGLVRVYRGHPPTLSLFPDAEPFLEAMGAQGVMGLVTDGQAEVQRRKVDALGIAHHLDAVVYSDDYGPRWWKPHPRAFEECLQRLGREAAQSVYIGDNPHKDFLGPKRLGMLTIRVRRPGTLHAGTRLDALHEAAVEVSSLMEACSLLGSYGLMDDPRPTTPARAGNQETAQRGTLR